MSRPNAKAVAVGAVAVRVAAVVVPVAEAGAKALASQAVVVAVGAVAAARYRLWGAGLMLLGGAGVVIAWVLGDSGDPYRYYVTGALALFAVLVTLDRRAFVRPGAR